MSDEEIHRGRAASVGRLGATLQPAVWALAEATATTHEIPRVLADHIDLAAGTVLLSGSAKLEGRQAELTDWGARALGDRLEGIGTEGGPGRMRERAVRRRRRRLPPRRL